MNSFPLVVSTAVLQMGGDWMVWAALVPMVVFGLLLAVVVLVVVRFVLVPVIEWSDSVDGGEDTAAIDVLRERYARGEIDEDEFERRAAFLREQGR
jgi:putative membrane protein